MEDRTFVVEVPAGVEDGSTLRLADRGPAGPRGGPNGSLFVHLAVTADERFERVGDDLHTTVHVSMAQAALGTQRRGRHLGGAPPGRRRPGDPVRPRGPAEGGRRAPPAGPGPGRPVRPPGGRHPDRPHGPTRRSCCASWRPSAARRSAQRRSRRRASRASAPPSGRPVGAPGGAGPTGRARRRPRSSWPTWPTRCPVAERPHHLARVLRLRRGELVVAADGRGTWCRAGSRAGGAGRTGRSRPTARPRARRRPRPAAHGGLRPGQGRPARVGGPEADRAGRRPDRAAGTERSVVRWDGARAERAVARLAPGGPARPRPSAAGSGCPRSTGVEPGRAAGRGRRPSAWPAGAPRARPPRWPWVPRAGGAPASGRSACPTVGSAPRCCGPRRRRGGRGAPGRPARRYAWAGSRRPRAGPMARRGRR